MRQLLTIRHKFGGFTLLETVVALAVITAAVAGPVSLITRGIFDSRFARNKLVGINLAEEGIEIIRKIRDDNILCDEINGANPKAWNAHPQSGTALNGRYAVDPGATWVMDCTPLGGPPASINTPNPTSFCDIDPLRLAGNTYTYSGGLPTIFYRCVVVCSPPGDTVVDPECVALPDPDLAGGETDQMDIIAKVWWNERGLTKEVRIRERLYNWR